MIKGVIYDIGANNGHDIPYYLMRADKVVAVEANPSLCKEIRTRFCSEIEEGRLVLIQGAAVADDIDDLIEFGIHRVHHVLSSTAYDKASMDYETIRVKPFSLAKIIQEHGDPLYIKLDIEGHEPEIIEALFLAGIFPKFISVEIHDPRGALLLLAERRYRYFNIVEGQTVREVYKDYPLEVGGDKIIYSFPHHSAGPFGHDLQAWTSRGDTVFRLGTTGFGWKDFHASSEDVASFAPYPQQALRRDTLLKIASSLE
jgi:FkbM family methyltransferase